MSRIGNKPINVPNNVKITVYENSSEHGGKTMVSVEGPKGSLTSLLPSFIKVNISNEVLIMERESDKREHKEAHGLARTTINNMVEGVTVGYRKSLEINGIGYRVQKQGNKIILNLGYSHPVEYDPPTGIALEVIEANKIDVVGIDKQLVGQVAATIKNKRKPDAYKGKGIIYKGQKLKLKAGKAGGKGGKK